MSFSSTNVPRKITMATASHHKNFSVVKTKIDDAFNAREPELKAKLTQALNELDSKYAEIRSKYFS